MNKLIVTKKDYFINGNTALVPEKKRTSEEYDKLNKQKKESLKKIKKRKHINQARIMMSITLTFVVGFTIIFRYAQIYSMQKQLSSCNKEINNLQKSKEDLRIELVKCSNLQNVENRARTEFNMKDPIRNQAIFADLSKNNFKDIKNDNKKQVNVGVIDKIKSMFF